MSNAATSSALVAIQQSAVALVDDETSRAVGNSINAGLTGGGFGNRISLRGNRFRFIKGGADVGVSPDNYLDVVMIAANPHVSRIYFKGQYEAGSKERPDCYSVDGRTPEPDSPELQSDKCMTCPQNAKGSSLKGDSKAKACAYKKRVIMASPDAIDGDLYALDVNAMSLFGDDMPAQNLYNLKSYIETTAAHGMMAVKLVTRLTFDDNSSVPKLFFQPIRMLTPEEWEMVKDRMKDDAIQTMLADVINEQEVGTVAPEKVLPQKPAAQTAPQAPAPKAVAPAPKPAQPAAPAAPIAPRRGRPPARPASAAAPAPEPELQPAVHASQQAAPRGNGQQRGFGVAKNASAADTSPAQSAPPAEGAPKAKGFTIDLDEFDA